MADECQTHNERTNEIEQRLIKIDTYLEYAKENYTKAWDEVRERLSDLETQKERNGKHDVRVELEYVKALDKAEEAIEALKEFKISHKGEHGAMESRLLQRLDQLVTSQDKQKAKVWQIMVILFSAGVTTVSALAIAFLK